MSRTHLSCSGGAAGWLPPTEGRARASAALALLWCALLLLLGPAAARGQNVEYTQNAADLKLRGDLTVNPSSQALELQITLGAYPGRAGLSVPVTISYSSKVWRVEYEGYRPPPIGSDGAPIGNGYTIVSAQYAENSKAGWTSSLSFPVRDLTGVSESYDQFGNAGCPSAGPCYFVDRMLFRMPDGSTHELRSTDQPQAAGAATGDNLYAVDGSRLRYQQSTQTLYMPDGGRYVYSGSAPPKYIDRHGNTLTYATAGVTDTLGRVISRPPLLDGPGDATYTPPGATGAYTFKWRQLGDPGVLTGGGSVNFVADTGCPHGTGAYSPRLFTSSITDGCIANAGTQHNPTVLYQIVLPNGRAYTFTYNVYGEIDKVVYPTGGYERFEYAQTRPLSSMSYPYVQANRGVVRRYVSEAGTGAGEVLWQYGDLGANGTVSVTAPDGSRSDRYLYTDTSMSGTFGYSSGSSLSGAAYEERVYSAPDAQGARRMLRRKLTQWAVTGSNATSLFPGAQQFANRNPRVVKEVEIILDRTGNALAKTTTYGYDLTYEFSTGAMQTSVSEYDFAEVSQATAQGGAISSMPAGALLRKTETAYLDATQTYRDRNLLGLPTSVTVRNGAGVAVAQTTTSYDEAADYPLLACGATTGWTNPSTAARGDATTTRRWLDTAAAWVETHAQFDQCGNVRKNWDARGNLSQIDYSATYQAAYPTHTVSPAPDPAGTYGSDAGLETTTAYEFATGLVTSTTDANGQTTTFSYSDDAGVRDPLNRLRRVTRPAGGGTTKYNYGFSTNAGRSYYRTETITALDAARSVYAYQFYDGLGRPFRALAYEGAAAGTYLTTDTQYDAMGRVWRVSNPYRTTGFAAGINPSGHWTVTEYDELGRVVSVTTPDDPARDALPAGDPDRQEPFANDARLTTAYDGNRVRVTDQAGKARDSYTDALGRLDTVVEDPLGLNYATTYDYDALGNLRAVAQGTQRRYFMYDSLGRLIRAKNPEQSANAALSLTDPVTGNAQWSFAYSYDANGNLAQRTDPRNVAATYTYDALNRNTTVNYSDATPDVARYYDGATLGLGRAWKSEAAGVSRTTVSQYDALGRPKACAQQFWDAAASAWGASFNTTRLYDLAGNVTSQTYPSGRSVSYAYDAAGRLLDFTGTLGDGVDRDYATGALYDESGGRSQERFGTASPLYSKRFYNVRGQLAEVRVGTKSITSSDPGHWNRGAILNVYSAHAGWTESGSDNNGNLAKDMIFLPNDDQLSGWMQIVHYYGYDALNRLKSVEEKLNNTSQSFVQAYSYDRWGNRTIDAALTTNAPEPAFTVNAANNRLAPPAGFTMTYDAAGNLTFDNYTGEGTRTYDAENRMKTAQFVSGSAQTAAYAYDADGRRVKRDVGASPEVWQVYGMEGELLAEYGAGAAPGSPQKEYGYRAGELLVTLEAGQRVNVALSSNGATAAASSTYDANRLPAAAINGDRQGLHYGSDPTTGSGWVDATQNSFPDWLEVTFAGSRTIDEVDVFGVQDSLNSPQEPTPTTTWTAYGLSAFQVQYWTGAAWAAVPGGSVTGNNLVWRKVTFPAVTTSKIRVLTQAGGGGFSRVVELEAWGAGADARWLVADHLGTPRMVLDAGGQLSGVTRHDYLPFGEELAAGAGGRTTVQGYGAADDVRQKFTGKERDGETGLDYVVARYYSSAQGRFTAVDPSTKSMKPVAPQTWNRYSHALNNPLLYVDRNGKWPTPIHDKILRAAFDRLSEGKLKQIQRGSRSVDFEGLSPKTLYEHNAPQHAMTPGSMIRALGSEAAAREWAKNEAGKFIDAKFNRAETLYKESLQADSFFVKDVTRSGAYRAFGEGAHTLMDNVSPAHRDFKVYDLEQYNTFLLKATNMSITLYALDMDAHKQSEDRDPTDAEMNEMKDTLRESFRAVFGEAAYREAVSQEERDATERRLRPGQ